MSDTTNPDPRRPWKAYAAALAAVLGVLLAEYAEALPPLVVVLLGALAAGLAAYVTPNPKTPATRPAHPRPRWRRRG